MYIILLKNNFSKIRNSILLSLPHSPHHLPTIKLKHFQLDAHNVHHNHHQQEHYHNSNNHDGVQISFYNLIEDPIILKSDGIVTYLFPVAKVDVA